MRKIAVVDDEVEILQIIKNELGDEIDDVIVNTFESPETFLDDRDLQNYDMIISDIKMPRMNGVQLYEKVTSLGYDGFFIFISGCLDSYVREIDTFVNSLSMEKPIDFDQLKNTIIQMFHLKKQYQKMLTIFLEGATRKKSDEFRKSYSDLMKMKMNLSVMSTVNLNNKDT